MMKKIFLLCFLFPLTLLSQLDVDKAGDDWDKNVYIALHLVYGVSPSHYLNIIENVNKVEFWNQDYSSNDGEKTIVISTKDIKLNSINNIASVLVHESCHILLSKTGVKMDKNSEEHKCYTYELEFLQKIPNVEKDLINHTKQQIKKFNTQ